MNTTSYDVCVKLVNEKKGHLFVGYGEPPSASVNGLWTFRLGRGTIYYNANQVVSVGIEPITDDAEETR